MTIRLHKNKFSSCKQMSFTDYKCKTISFISEVFRTLVQEDTIVFSRDVLKEENIYVYFKFYISLSYSLWYDAITIALRFPGHLCPTSKMEFPLMNKSQKK